MKYSTISAESESTGQTQVPQELCLHRMFEMQAAHTPDLTALIFESGTFSYGDLNRRANQLAHHLRKQGVGPGAMVAVCLERSWEMVVALLGVLKAGGAYVPLDPEYPSDRLTFMVNDAQAGLLLTQTPLLPRLSGYGAATFCFDCDWATLQGESDTDLPGGAEPDDLAYVIYTSGSTGVPKGVEIAHRGVCNNLRWRQETFPLTSHDRLLQTYSFSFDPSVWAFFWPLTAGAAVVLPQPNDTGDPARLVQAIARHQISVLGFSPSMLAVLLGHPDLSRCLSLRHVFSGGEALTPNLRDRFFNVLPQTALHNVYGPTEATIDATWWDCRPGGSAVLVPIGLPLPQMQVYVLDEDGQLVGEGAPGELHIAGVGLARGYLRRPELTAERFVTNPFCRDDQERTLYPTLYRTGDLCRWRADGALEYLGRLDQQVKLRGFRIELGEIESQLLKEPGVREAAVSVREDRVGDPRLIAYIVSDAGMPLSRAELRGALQSTLPTHMVPGGIVFLDALPLSPSGKLDRNALPVPGPGDWGASNEVLGDGRVAPRTALERQLVAVFEELLGVGPLGATDDFFAWGGHSLLAARLAAEVSRRTGRTLGLTDLADGATAERLARLLERREEQGTSQTGRPQAGPAEALLQRWSDGPGHPLFFWHGDFTGGFYCGALARHLGPRTPLYGFLPHGMDGGTIPTTIEAMASEYVATVRAVQPHGPYRLAGFCNGALVAYEVARQLRATGQEVALLALIEIVVPATLVKLRLHQAACRLGRRLGLGTRAQHRCSVGLQASISPIILGLKMARGIWEKWMRRWTSAPGPDWAEIIPVAYRNTAAHYHLRPYPGRITLLAAEEGSGWVRDLVGGHAAADVWRHLAQDIVCGLIPGDHFSSLKAHLPDLALRLHACLAEEVDEPLTGPGVVEQTNGFGFAKAPEEPHAQCSAPD